jgi:hypothetical protein
VLDVAERLGDRADDLGQALGDLLVDHGVLVRRQRLGAGLEALGLGQRLRAGRVGLGAAGRRRRRGLGVAGQAGRLRAGLGLGDRGGALALGVLGRRVSAGVGRAADLGLQALLGQRRLELGRAGLGLDDLLAGAGLGERAGLGGGRLGGLGLRAGGRRADRRVALGLGDRRGGLLLAGDGLAAALGVGDAGVALDGGGLRAGRGSRCSRARRRRPSRR